MQLYNGEDTVKRILRVMFVSFVLFLGFSVNETSAHEESLSGWQLYENNWYYYAEGVMQTGWQYIDDKWYYMEPANGVMRVGWLNIGEQWYYLNVDGVMLTGWGYIGDEWYYLDSSGVMQTGWQIIDGQKYMFDAAGKMIEGAKQFIIDVSKWQGSIDWDAVATTAVDGVIVRCGHGDETTEKNGNWKDDKFGEYIDELNRLQIPYGIYYYNTATTVEQAETQATNAVTMIADSNAKPTLPVFVDIEQDGGECDLVAVAKVYMEKFLAYGYKPGIYANNNYWKNYLDDSSLDAYYKWVAAYGNNSGEAKSGFIPEGGIEKYMMWQYTSQGKLAGIEENEVDFNILFQWYEKAEGWKLLHNAWYYYENGCLAYGWKFISGKWYYFANGGIMQTGWQFMNDCWYYMDENGAMVTGWKLLEGKWYYLDKDGSMCTGWKFLNNCWYYMNQSGAMMTGWNHLDGNWYHLKQDGTMSVGWQYLGKHWFYMNQSGVMQVGWHYLSGNWYYMNQNGEMLTGRQKIDGKTHRFHTNGVWIG